MAASPGPPSRTAASPGRAVPLTGSLNRMASTPRFGSYSARTASGGMASTAIRWLKESEPGWPGSGRRGATGWPSRSARMALPLGCRDSMSG